MLVDPERVKKIENLTVIFIYLGSAHVKASSKTLMKLSPVNLFFLELILCEIRVLSEWVSILSCVSKQQCQLPR